MPVRDLTGGFKCFRREVLEAIDLASVECTGYAFQIELTYRALRRGFRVVEVPIVFADRRVGQSKMSRRIVLEAMRKVWSMRFSPLRAGGAPARGTAARRLSATASRRWPAPRARGTAPPRWSREILSLSLVSLSAIFFVVDPFVGGPVLPRDDARATPAEERRETALRAALTAGVVLAAFALAGAWIFRLLGISLGAFRIAGGDRAAAPRARHDPDPALAHPHHREGGRGGRGEGGHRHRPARDAAPRRARARSRR